MSLKEWLPLFGITVSAFIFNTSEFMPIGLLTDIADSFHITEAHAGVLITVYSWIVMLLSLPLMLLLNKIDFKRLLLGTIALFGIFQMLSAFSASYEMLMISRIGVACTHSVFWSIASPAAVSVVSEKFRSLALSMVVTGTSIAMILGLPLGRIIGLHMGWNMAFFCVGIIAFITTAYLIFVFPKVPGGESFSIKQMPEIFKNKTLMGIFLVTFYLPHRIIRDIVILNRSYRRWHAFLLTGLRQHLLYSGQQVFWEVFYFPIIMTRINIFS